MSPVVGVGSRRIVWFSESGWPRWFPASNPSYRGVGSEEEEPLSAVGRSDIGSANACPCRVIPEVGQRSQDLGKRSSSVDSKETWDVLKKDVPGSKLPNNSRELRP